jgi:hypothetical protein
MRLAVSTTPGSQAKLQTVTLSGPSRQSPLSRMIRRSNAFCYQCQEVQARLVVTSADHQSSCELLVSGERFG